jgi:hypothetical protein
MCFGGGGGKSHPVQQPNTKYEPMPMDDGMPTVRLQDRAGNSNNPGDVMGKDLGLSQNPPGTTPPASNTLTQEY